MTSRFEKEFVRHTRGRSRSLRGRLFAHSVVLDIKKVNSTEMRLMYIETMRCKRTGLATEAMSWLCELADAYNVQLSLTPVPYDRQSMNVVQLTKWYQSFGFVRIGMQDEMVRYAHACCV
jgi:hypothetical protein